MVAPDAGRRPALTRLRAVIVLAILLPTAAFAAVASYLYHQEFRDARLRLDRSARIAQEHALKLLETNEMLLQRMLDLLGDAARRRGAGAQRRLHVRLQRMAADLPQVQGLFVHGADSRSLGNSRVHPPPRQIDYSDREWYRAHRSGGAAVYHHRGARQPRDRRAGVRHEPAPRRCRRHLRRHACT